MNDIARQTLADIIAYHASPPELDVRHCERLLRDYLCCEHKKEIFVLVAALCVRVVADLLSFRRSIPTTVLLTRCVRKLHDQTGIVEEFAQWSVDSWAMALGVIAQNTVPAVGETIPTPPPSLSPPEVWYYSKDGRNWIGPISPSDLKKLTAAGQLSPIHMVWKEGMVEWVSASSVKSLFPKAAPPFIDNNNYERIMYVFASVLAVVIGLTVPLYFNFFAWW